MYLNFATGDGEHFDRVANDADNMLGIDAYLATEQLFGHRHCEFD